MTVTILSKLDLIPVEQSLMIALAMGEKYPLDGFLDHAADLIKNNTAEKLFTPDTENLSNKNVLHYAIKAHDTENSLALINKDGVTPEQLFQRESRFGLTPLHEAINEKNEKIALALIEKDGVTAKHLKLENKDGKTASDMANDKNMKKVVAAINKKLLIETIQTTIPTHKTEQQLQH